MDTLGAIIILIITLFLLGAAITMAVQGAWLPAIWFAIMWMAINNNAKD